MQKNSQCSSYLDLQRFGLLPSEPLINQKNIRMNFKSKTDSLTLSVS